MTEITQDFLKSAINAGIKVGSSGTINPKYLAFYGTHLEFDQIKALFDGSEDSKESAHLFYGYDKLGSPEVWQFAPFTAKTWHAGASHYQGHHGLNGFAIGIYVQNETTGKCGSIATLIRETLPCIINHYNIRDMVALKRPHTRDINIDEFKRLVEYGNADSVGRFVAVHGVAVREGPAVQFGVIERLNPGDGVKVLRYSTDGEWAYVLYQRKEDNEFRQGWTHESFLKRL